MILLENHIILSDVHDIVEDIHTHVDQGIKPAGYTAMGGRREGGRMTGDGQTHCPAHFSVINLHISKGEKIAHGQASELTSLDVSNGVHPLRPYVYNHTKQFSSLQEKENSSFPFKMVDSHACLVLTFHPSENICSSFNY